MLWKKVTLIGVGLLGGSLGMALKRAGLAGRVVGLVRRAASVRECKRLGAVDLAMRDLERAVRGADLVVVCTPVGQLELLAPRLAQCLKADAVVTDVGSVKTSVVRALERTVAEAGAHFVGSHPMAGAEKSGVAAARPDLFAGALCVITPTAHSNQTVVCRVKQLWESIGSRVLQLTPEKHDELVGRSSHLTQVVSATLARFVLDPAFPKEQAMLCANGFRDTTRIASGSPEMWRDIAVANRSNLGGAMDSFMLELQKIRQMIAAADAPAIELFLSQAKSRRDHWNVAA